jgi:xanthosine utilization system XapX-like protein
VLFGAYFRLSWTAPVNSDGAANIFQAWAMLHGNLLLHGWWLSDASFYTTELPQYALIEAVLGPIPSVIHLAAAMTYTLAVLLAAVVAKGKATGREGALRMVIAAGIMLAPQPGGGIYVGGGVFVLDLSLGHIGTAVPLLLAWLVLDRAGTRRWVPPAAGILLAWVLIADPLVTYVGIVPVVVVYGVRAYREVVVARRRVASAWFEIAMVTSALAAMPVAAAVSAVLRSLGGFAVYPDHPLLVTGSGLVNNVTVTFESVLTLFGANFLGLPVGFDLAAALLHLAGLALAGWAVWFAIRRLARGTWPGGTVDEVMAVAVLANLIAFVFSTLAIDPSYAREIAVVLPFSAALAGRLLPARSATARLLPLLSVVLVGYMFTLAHGVVQPPAKPTPTQQLASWLAARHFHYGLGGYWQASSITLATSQRVQVRPIDLASHKKVGAYPWESNASWYDPTLHYANFVILDPGTPSYHADGTWAMIRATWGNPVRFYRVGAYRVLVYHKNLLVGLGCGEVYSRTTGTASTVGPRCS